MLQQHMTHTRSYDENLQYEAVILPRYDSAIRNHSAVHAYELRTASSVTEDELNGNHLYLPLTQLYPYRSTSVDGNEPKFMARPHISGHLWIHKPLYRNSLHNRNEILYRSPSQIMSLTHYVHQYSHRADKDKASASDPSKYQVDPAVDALSRAMQMPSNQGSR